MMAGVVSNTDANALKKMKIGGRFSTADLTDIYTEFLSMVNPKDKDYGISKVDFIEKIKILNNDWSLKLAEKIYNAIEKSNAGYVSFPEFVTYLDNLYHGTQNEKLRFSFKVMDDGKKGYLTPKDIRITLEILMNVHAIMTGDSMPSVDYIDSVAAYTMDKIDTDRHSQINWREFKAANSKNEELMNVFQILSGHAIKTKFEALSACEVTLKDIAQHAEQINQEFKEILAMMEAAGGNECIFGNAGSEDGVINKAPATTPLMMLTPGFNAQKT